MCLTNLKWRLSEVVSTNSSNSLRFLHVEMDKMSDGINGDFNNEDSGTLLTRYEALPQARLAEEDEKISGRMQPSCYH